MGCTDELLRPRESRCETATTTSSREVTRMPRTMLLVGTRKGLFVLESDDRRDWSLRGPLCEGWPVYHAIHDPATGSLYAAAASEWHGAGVWRSADRGETWELSSEGLVYGDDAG